MSTTLAACGIAVLMSCLGLVVMAAVLAQVIAKLPSQPEQFYRQARLINEKKILILYLPPPSSWAVSVGGQRGGGLAQIVILCLAEMVFFLVYAYVSWINKKNRLILLAMILLNF